MQTILDHEDAELGNAVLLDAAPRLEQKPVSRAQAMLGGISKRPVQEIEVPEEQPVVQDFQEPEPVKEQPVEKDPYGDLRTVLANCVTVNDVEDIMSRLPDFLDEISTAACKGADELANARKAAITKGAK